MLRRKKAKERLIIAFFANAAGGKEQPIVLGSLPRQVASRELGILRNLKESLTTKT